jgi:hypothetical protein
MPTTQSFICRESPSITQIPASGGAPAYTTATLANRPNANTDQVFLNGVLQNPGTENDYTLTDKVVRFARVLQPDEVVLVNYILDVFTPTQEETSSNTANNSNRTDLIHWCLRKLGAPVIEINVDEDQIEDRVDEALMYFRDYHFDGVERVYLHHQITASEITLQSDFNADILRGAIITGVSSGATATAFDKGIDKRTLRFAYKKNSQPFELGETIQIAGLTETGNILSIVLGDVDNKYIPVGTKILSITNIIPQQSSTIGGNLGGMFDFQYQFALHNMFNLASTDLVTYDIYKRYISTWEFMFRGAKGIRFNRKTDRVYLDVDSWTVDQWVVLEAWASLDPSKYNEIYMDEFVREYAYNLIKLQWGANLKKFTGIQLPGSVTLNGQQIYDEANEALKELRERVKKEFELPPDFMVG